MDFSHSDGFATKVVTWVDPSPAAATAPASAVTVRIAGTTVTVGPAGDRPREYRGDGERFVRKR